MAVTAVLLDLYDTLVRIDAALYEATLASMAAVAGVPVAEFRMAWDGTGRAASTGGLPTTADRARAALAALQPGGSDPAAATRVAAIETRFQREAARLYDGTLEALAALRQQGLRLALVCNVTAASRQVPEQLGITRYLDAVIVSCEVGAMKPEPAIYLAACARLGVQPAACLFAGDGGNQELNGARTLGMRTVWIDQPRNAAWGSMTSTVYDYRLARIAELPALVSALNDDVGTGVGPAGTGDAS